MGHPFSFALSVTQHVCCPVGDAVLKSGADPPECLLERSAVADVAAGCDAGVVGVHRRAWWCEGHGMPCPYCCKYIRRAAGGQCRWQE